MTSLTLCKFCQTSWFGGEFFNRIGADQSLRNSRRLQKTRDHYKRRNHTVSIRKAVN